LLVIDQGSGSTPKDICVLLISI